VPVTLNTTQRDENWVCFRPQVNMWKSTSTELSTQLTHDTMANQFDLAYVLTTHFLILFPSLSYIGIPHQKSICITGYPNPNYISNPY